MMRDKVQGVVLGASVVVGGMRRYHNYMHTDSMESQTPYCTEVWLTCTLMGEWETTPFTAVPRSSPLILQSGDTRATEELSCTTRQKQCDKAQVAEERAGGTARW